MFIKDKLINYFGKNIKLLLNHIDFKYFEDAEEIRIRIDRCIIIKSFDKEYFILKNGEVSLKYIQENIYKPSLEDIKQTIETMSNYSIYAFEQEIRSGFINLKGGFRAGITGRVIYEENKIKTIKNISSINIRIAKEIKGCSKKILEYIYDSNIKSTIIISPPNCGKTTLLRDIIRTISNINENVGLVDERSEIAATYMGKTELDIGIRTDILDRCNKSEGMMMLLRSMAPSVIAVDEIGSDDDIYAIERVSNSGVKLICTIHSENIEQLKNKKGIKKILDKGIFERFVILNRERNVCNIDKIYNENFINIYKEED